MHETTASGGSGRDDELIERYLRGDLVGTELDAFEVRLLDEPELLARSEGLAQFQSALRQHGVDASARRGILAGIADAFADLWRKPGHAFAFATCAVVVAGATWLLVAPGLRHADATLVAVRAERDALQARLATFSAGAVPAVFEMPLLRGGDASPDLTIALAPDAGPVALTVPLPAAAVAPYRIEIRDAADAVLLSQDDARPNLRDRLLLMLPPGRLSPGDYRIVIGSGDARVVHRLRVVAVEPSARSG